MRSVTIALAAIPVLVAGLGLAVAAGGIDPLDPFVPTSEDTLISPHSETDGESQGSDSGTRVDGRRPHLSVIDGHSNLFLPAPLPAFLSLLPGSATDLAPLPPPRESREVPASTQNDASRTENAPATGSARQHPDTRPAPRPSRPPESTAGGARSASPPWTPAFPDIPPRAADPGPPRAIGDPRSGRDLPDSLTVETTNQVRPPHADTQGPPPHAGTPGPPPHAGQARPSGHANGNGNGNGNADNGNTGRDSAGNRNGPPTHAATGGRPDHAGGGPQKSDDSRPGPR